MILEQYGFTNEMKDAFNENSQPGLVPARIITEHRGLYRVVCESGERFAEISGKYHYHLEEKGGYPAVGDWVVLEAAGSEDRAVIHDILPRKTQFIRRDSWSADGMQVVAANFDIVFICTSLNKNYNLRRIERYLTLSWESGAIPAIILSKADLCEDVERKVLEVEAIAPGVKVHVVSAVNGTGLEELQGYLSKGVTMVMLGSSGVGKSTLINALAGKEVLKTSAAREDDDRGRHTTTHRQMVLLPQGGVLLDTPGMRELGIVNAEEGLGDAFSDISEIAANCRFNDCKHHREPGCAVKRALADGTLDPMRYENYLKLKKEAKYVESKENRQLQVAQKQQNKKLSKFSKEHRKSGSWTGR